MGVDRPRPRIWSLSTCYPRVLVTLSGDCPALESCWHWRCKRPFFKHSLCVQTRKHIRKRSGDSLYLTLADHHSLRTVPSAHLPANLAAGHLWGLEYDNDLFFEIINVRLTTGRY